MNNSTENNKMTEKIPINRWTLSFNESLEAEYSAWAKTTHLMKFRVNLLIGLAIVLFLAGIDYFLQGSKWHLSSTMYIVVGLPLIGAALGATFVEAGRRYLRYINLALSIFLPFLQAIILWQMPAKPVAPVLSSAVMLGILFAYSLAVLASDFLVPIIGHVVVYLLVLLFFTTNSHILFERNVTFALLCALLVILLLCGAALYYRIYADKRYYYLTKGQSRFVDKVAPMTKSDPVIKKVESPINKMFYAISDVIWFITTEGDIAYVSPSVKEFMGYEPEELIGKRAITLMPPEVYRDFESKATRLYKDKNIVQEVFSFRTKAGLLKSGEIHLRAYSDNEHGDGYIGATRPISEEKIKQKASSEKRLKDLTEENASLKNDVHGLTAEIDTLTEKLTLVNRELTASDKIGRQAFSSLLSQMLDSYQEQLTGNIEAQRLKVKQLTKKFNEKSMGKYDLKNYLENALIDLNSQIDEMAFASNCYQLYNEIVAKNKKIITKPYNISTLFERTVIELKQTFSQSEHVINIDCSAELFLETDERLFSNIVRYLILKSLTQSFKNCKKGRIKAKVFQFNADVVIEYKDDGKASNSSTFETFFVDCLQKSGYQVSEETNLFFDYIKRCMNGTVSSRVEEGSEIFVITLPNQNLTGEKDDPKTKTSK